jgi:hypothetical protein
MKMQSLKTDPIKAKDGVWIDDIPEFAGVRLKVRPQGNPDYRSLYQRLVATVPRSQKRGGVISDQAVKSQIEGRCLADTVLVDWEGFEDDYGGPLVYSEDQAKQYLLDPEMQALRDAVNWAAGVAEEEARATLEDDAGNSKPLSAGNLSGPTS